MIPILAALLGGAAEGIYMTGKNAQDEEQKMRMRQFESDLEAKRLATVEAMREKAEQAKEERKRQGNVNDAKTIESDATKRAQARDLSGIEKARGLVNVDPAEREPISPEDVKTMRGMMTPEFAKQNYGLEPETRTQSLRDKADAAQGIGRTDMATNFEKSADEERKFALDKSNQETAQKKLEQAAAETARKEAADRGREDAKDAANQRMWAALGLKGDKSGNLEAKDRSALLAAERGNQISLKGEMASLDKELENMRTTVNGKPNPDVATNRAAKAELATQLQASRNLTTALSNQLAKSLGIDVDTVNRVVKPVSPEPAPKTTQTLPPDQAAAVNAAMSPPEARTSPPTGAIPIGRTPDGRTVYKTTDGKQIAI